MKYPLVTGIVGILVAFSAAENVFEALKRRPELSKFYELVVQDETAKVVLAYKPVTLFAPVNHAVEEAETRLHHVEGKVASYHILLQLAEKSIFPTNVGTFLSGAAPIFLTSRASETNGVTEYFVNNARITDTIEFRTQDNSKQIMYIIDEVLEPYVPITGYPPDALAFLNNPSIYNIKDNVGAFNSRVRSEKEENEFQQAGNHTFFIPIGIGDSENINRLREIDSMVIKGHVIPNQVMFTRVMGGDTFKSDAYNEYIKVEISLMNSTLNDGGYVLKVKSNTLQSDPRHKKGVVLSRIVRANIPVRNGVVHLIESPLMIIDISVWQFITNEQDGRVRKFLELVHYAPDFLYDVQSQQEKTVFAPSNEAIERLGADKIGSLKSNISALTSLLRLHMVKTSVSSDDVKSKRIPEYFSSDTRRKLYFSTIGDDRNRTLTVQGGGVNAQAVQADIGATDGIIHIIDRVLGMPYLTVYETLKETETELNLSPYDPSKPGYDFSDQDSTNNELSQFSLSETFQMSSQDQWNLPLMDINKKYTFFAPSNAAWKKMEDNMPTPYKQLKMGTYQHYVHKILDRHLMVGKVLNSHDLEKETEDIQMVNAKLRIEKGFRPDELYLVWEGVRAKIVRPDVQATNGIIHIIDHVIMNNRDLIKSEASGSTTSSVITLVLGVLLTAL